MKNTLKGNIDSKIREMVLQIGAGGFIGEHNMVHTPTLEAYISQLKQLMNEFADELIEKDEKAPKKKDFYYPGERNDYAWIRIRNDLRSEMRERKEELLR